jgi:tetratricopeptide (TPR) repeat protein
MVQAASGSLAEAVERAAALLATDPAGAEQQATAILNQAPGDPRARLILASARRRQGDAQTALSLLEPLVQAFPNAARTRFEVGMCLAALGRMPGAIEALRKAVSLDPQIAEAWRALGDLLFMKGDVRAAEAAFAQHTRASVRDPRLAPIAASIFSGRINDAESQLHRHLTANPDDPEALALLADIFVRQSRRAHAEAALEKCVALAPDFDGARFSYAHILYQRQKATEALPHVEHLLARAPRDAAYRNLMAACLTLVGEYERVNAIYEDLLADYDQQPKIWLNYGHTLRTVGRRDDAIAAYRRCIDLAPDLGDAYWSLANLKVETFSADQREVMQAQLRRPDLADEDRLHLHYALGKALEDEGEAEASFAHYVRGAEIRRRGVPYRAQDTTVLMERTKALFTPEFLAARAGSGDPAPDPMFIVGLPRAGSTLVEQILASHSQVEGTMELPDLGLIAHDLDRDARRRGGRYPDVLAALAPADFAALGGRYLETTRIHRKLGRPFYIDKMPNNFQHVGLIHLILPNARIIDARRHPMASCFSAFKQHFAEGQDFTYDLTDLGLYYRDYVALMAHFDAVLPGRVHRVIYEDMVEDPEGQIRRLLDYCGLPFEEGCLNFHKNDRAVRTVSSEQVRRPIFREGLDQWRRYEPWLKPLEAALGPALETWRG